MPIGTSDGEPPIIGDEYGRIYANLICTGSALPPPGWRDRRGRTVEPGVRVGSCCSQARIHSNALP
jgi:hypothetical protein